MNMVTVHVTRAHINEGECADPRRCPLALALNDATGKRWVVIPPEMRILSEEDEVTHYTKYIVYMMDGELQSWTRQFDLSNHNVVKREDGSIREILREVQREDIPEITFEFDLDDRNSTATMVNA